MTGIFSRILRTASQKLKAQNYPHLRLDAERQECQKPLEAKARRPPELPDFGVKGGRPPSVALCRIHLLHDSRGPVLEAIVARTIRQIETTQDIGRFFEVWESSGFSVRSFQGSRS